MELNGKVVLTKNLTSSTSSSNSQTKPQAKVQAGFGLPSSMRPTSKLKNSGRASQGHILNGEFKNSEPKKSARGRPKGQSSDRRSYGPLGDLIRKYRLLNQKGLLEVAEACGCSVQFISNIEHGRAPLPWDKAQQLAKALRIPFEELQAANLAMRADFQSFMGERNSLGASQALGALQGKKPARNGNTVSAQKGKSRVLKNGAASQANEALQDLKDAASWIALTARDPELRDLLQRVQTAPTSIRKRFYQTARRMLA